MPLGLEKIDEGPERRGHVAAAVVVEVGPFEGLPPVLEDGRQAAIGERLSDEVLEGVDDTQAVDRRTGLQVMGGGHELALWRYAQGSTVLLEFKNTHLAALETMAEQLMPGQIGWVSRRAVGREVARRRSGDEALPARADGNGDHVLGQAFLVAHPGVVARRDDVDKGVLHHHFDVHRRVELEEAAQ